MNLFHFTHNQTLPNKHGIDGTGELRSNPILELCYVVDGHSKHPSSDVLVSNFHLFILEKKEAFRQLVNDDHEIKEFLQHLIREFHISQYRQLIPAAMSICLLIFNPEKVYSVHLGDCRLGLIVEKELTWLTYPHSLTMCQIEDRNSEDLEEILRSSHDNHILTNSLNTKRIKKIEINIFNKEEGTYLLATDGLWKLDIDKILLTVENKENYDEIDDLAFVIANP